ncbi:MAG: glycosyltransferase family 4 protein [Salibacteraceae bacterium]
MKTILLTAYAVNPYKGSEDGMGWNFIHQAALHQNIIAVTRKNNRPAIEKFLEAHPDHACQSVTWAYYDLPYWMRFWKKGSRGALLYYLLWQVFLPLMVWRRQYQFDLAHHLNFHNDWTPSFLWLLGKPLIWGPIGHHPKVPREFILPVYGFRAWWMDRTRWMIKNWFWRFDPFLLLTVRKANRVLSMNRSVAQKLPQVSDKQHLLPSVGTEWVEDPGINHATGFEVLSVGRLVPLKGFDVTIRAFAAFFHRLSPQEKIGSKLTIIGDGPEKKRLQGIAFMEGVAGQVEFVPWMERSELTQRYTNAAVFLFPSHEGAGMVVAEALSYRLPVVCFNNPGPGELTNSQCAFQIPYGNYSTSVKSFAEALLNLHQNPYLRRKMGTHARERFEERFNWTAKGRHLQRIYNQVFFSHASVHRLLPLAQ